MSVIFVSATPDAVDIISYCARVSNPVNQTNFDTAGKLLKYLASHGHWSPFEMANMVLEINTTRDIGRQILRHRSFSFQEFSQRYAEVETPMVVRDVRMQDSKNRQSSLPCTDSETADWWKDVQEEHIANAFADYNAAIEQGIAKEVARALLPEGLTPTRMYMAGSIRSWIHYIQQRTQKGTQLEHREIALQCRRILLSLIPELGVILEAENATSS